MTYKGTHIKYKEIQIKYKGIQIKYKGIQIKYKGIQIKYTGIHKAGIDGKQKTKKMCLYGHETLKEFWMPVYISNFPVNFRPASSRFIRIFCFRKRTVTYDAQDPAC